MINAALAGGGCEGYIMEEPQGADRMIISAWRKYNKWQWALSGKFVVVDGIDYVDAKDKNGNILKEGFSDFFIKLAKASYNLMFSVMRVVTPFKSSVPSAPQTLRASGAIPRLFVFRSLPSPAHHLHTNIY